MDQPSCCHAWWRGRHVYTSITILLGDLSDAFFWNLLKPLLNSLTEVAKRRVIKYWVNKNFVSLFDEAWNWNQMPDFRNSTFSGKKIFPFKVKTIIDWFWLWFNAVNGVLSQNFAYNYFSGLPNTQFTCWMLNLFDHIFKQGNVFLVITGNKTTEQDKNNKISLKW